MNSSDSAPPVSVKPVTLAELKEATDRLVKEHARMRRASIARSRLPAGSSRARVTTANARHASACEQYDKLIEQYQALIKRANHNGIDFYP